MTYKPMPDDEWESVNHALFYVVPANYRRLIEQAVLSRIAEQGLVIVPKEQSEKYYELLFNVSVVFPNETRHQTALRYIRNAETLSDQCESAKEST